jgi:hypothetical protein
MQLLPIRFISEPIKVEFDETPSLEKKQGCPDRFAWHEDMYEVVELISEWHDYGRKGRMTHNMRPSHMKAARRRGSWGVGRDFYQVRTDTGNVFEIYYDRAPKNQADRKGTWVLFRELSEETESGDLTQHIA